MATPTLKEFFGPMIEGPLDPTFQAAPEVKAADGVPVDADPGLPDPDMMTQDVAKTSASSLNFFSKNVQSAVSKYNLQSEGFDSSLLQGFAQALDDFAYQQYTTVQNPASRQAFEVDYQKIAADWSKDLTKLFEKLLKLRGHSDLA